MKQFGLLWKITLCWFAGCLLSVGSINSFANHIAAVNISYRAVTQGQYIITVRMYRDCKNGNIMTTDIDIKFESVLCGISGTFVLPLITGDKSGAPQTGNFILLPCLGVTTCDLNQSEYAVEEFVYEDTLSLLQTCTDWIIGIQTPGLRNSNDVLQSSASHPIYVSALINNFDAPLNNSPVDSTKPPVAIFCVNFEYFFNQSVFDSDGDSLVYTLTPAQGFNGNAIPYDTCPDGLSYTYQNPISCGPPSEFVLDNKNGIIHFKPATGLISVFCITIFEYRNGKLIGSTKTDMQALISLSGNCQADTLNFKSDGTPPTGSNPAKHDTCLSQVIKVFFNSQVTCASITKSGSDFLFLNTFGDSLAIDSVSFICDTLGLADSILIYLNDPISIAVNGSYYLISKTGSDGNPIMSACDRPLLDTLEIRVQECPIAYIDLRNVSVIANDSIKIHWRTIKQDFPESLFLRYDVCRSPVPTDVCGFVVTSIPNINDTVYYDKTVDVSSAFYNYTIKLYQQISLLDTLSDSIQSILLLPDPAQPDTSKMFISWSPYWGWNAPPYHVMEKTGADGPWREIGTATNTSFTITKPLLANDYWLKVETRNVAEGLISESNWVKYKVNIWEPPNIFTPNYDGVNDKFFVNEIQLRGKTNLKVFNRWGLKVYEDEDYNNTWRGTKSNGVDLEEGTYYYLLEFKDGTNKTGFVTIVR